MAEAADRIDVEQDMRELIAEILEEEPSTIDGDAKFVRDLGMDSMMALEILAGIEKKYRIAIPEEMLPKFTDLNTTVQLVTTILQKNNKL